MPLFRNHTERAAWMSNSVKAPYPIRVKQAVAPPSVAMTLEKIAAGLTQPHARTKPVRQSLRSKRAPIVCNIRQSRSKPVPPRATLSIKHSIAFVLNDDSTVAALDQMRDTTADQDPSLEALAPILGSHAVAAPSPVPIRFESTRPPASLYGPDSTGRWKVYRIVNKAANGPYKGKYKVVWYGDKGGGKKPVTFEPRKQLIRDGFKKAILLVDRWIRKGRIGTLRKFARTEKLHGAVFTASSKGMCAFEAIQLASKLQRWPDAVPQSSVDSFVSSFKTKHGIDLKEGVTWTEINEFALQLRSDGFPLSYNAIRSNYLHESACQVSIVKTLNLPDGFYIVTGFRPDDLGHCFVLQVSGPKFLVHENEEEEEVETYGEWIVEMTFAQRIEISKRAK